MLVITDSTCKLVRTKGVWRSGPRGGWATFTSLGSLLWAAPTRLLSKKSFGAIRSKPIPLRFLLPFLHTLPSRTSLPIAPLPMMTQHHQHHTPQRLFNRPHADDPPGPTRQHSKLYSAHRQHTPTQPSATSDCARNDTMDTDQSAAIAALPTLSKLTLDELAADTSGPIWNELLQLSRQPGVCNLGQGSPDYAGSKIAREAAAEAMVTPEMSALNQYTLPQGLKSLQASVSTYYNKCYRLEEGAAAKRALKPANVLVTVGATEGLYATLIALIGPGDEVALFNPGFLWYLTTIRLAGATPVMIPLEGPDFAPDMAAVENAITPKTRVLLLNTPHNPCGHCFTKEELESLAKIALKYNLYVISDEVYENVTFGGSKHLRIADEEGMFERTITLCSASKLFSLTGWRVGWAISTPEILKGLTVVHTSTSYCSPSPLQHGLSVALEAEDGSFEGIPALIEGNARLLGDALREKGFGVTQPQGGHFLVADTTPLGMKGVECAKLLLTEAKVGVVPGLVFYFADPNDGEGADLDRPMVRFAICKRRETIEDAAQRIRAMNIPASSSST